MVAGFELWPWLLVATGVEQSLTAATKQCLAWGDVVVVMEAYSASPLKRGGQAKAARLFPSGCLVACPHKHSSLLHLPDPPFHEATEAPWKHVYLLISVFTKQSARQRFDPNNYAIRQMEEATNRTPYLKTGNPMSSIHPSFILDALFYANNVCESFGWWLMMRQAGRQTL